MNTGLCSRWPGARGAGLRVAGNAGWLFLRTALGIVVGGLVVRVVLDALGVSGYGVYSAVMGVVTVVSTFHGILQDTARRFLGHAMGQSDPEALQRAFSSSVLLTLLFCLGVAVLGETAGLAFVLRRLSLPEESRASTAFLYQVGLALMVLKTLQIPFAALIVVGERMAFFFWASVAELALSLLCAGAAASEMGPALEVYAVATLAAEAVVLAIHVGFCRRRFRALRLAPTFLRTPLREPGAFMGWSFLGAVGNVLKYQGVCLLVNQMAGVELCASWKVALHVWGFLSPVCADFNQALCPVIFKSWTKGGDARSRLVGVGTIVSFFLTTVPVVIVFCWVPEIVSAWLGASAPPNAVLFIRGLLFGLVFDAISQPLTTAIQASGRVVLYQVVSSVISSAGFFASWALLAAGLPAWTTTVAVMSVNGLGCLYRLFHVRVLMGVQLSR